MPGTADKIFGFLNVTGRSFEELNVNLTDRQLPPPSPLFSKED
jgi:hypothetical protein